MRIKSGIKKLLEEDIEIKINIKELDSLNFLEKSEKIRENLSSKHSLKNKIKSKEIIKIIDYIDNDEKNIVNINKELLLKRVNDELIICYRRGKVYLNIIFFILSLIIISILATYTYLLKERLLTLDKDINKDGIAELNIDVDRDGQPDINIDINNDNKPDYNINYRKNGKAIFNIKENKKYKNKINQDINKDGKCDINCDINLDGWPDMNLDLDGDGIADLFVDSEDKGYATLNIDIDGDKKCDINCDTDENYKCDENCLDFEVVKYIDINNNNVVVNINTGVPTIELTGNVVRCDNLYPTDQPNGGVLKECKAKFTIKNTSNIDASYNLRMNILENSFISDNMKYKINSNHDKSIPNYVDVPKSDRNIIRNITLKAHDTHEYNVSFILQGTEDEQNYDSGKSLNVKFSIGA